MPFPHLACPELTVWTQTSTQLQTLGHGSLSTCIFMQSAQTLLHSEALILTPTPCYCSRLSLFPAVSTELSLWGSCNSIPYYFIIWVKLGWPGDLCLSVSLSQQGCAFSSYVLDKGSCEGPGRWSLPPHHTALPHHKENTQLPSRKHERSDYSIGAV